MAAGNQRSPRMPRNDTIGAAAAALRAASTGEGASAILAFRINGTSPFGETALCAAEAALQQLHAGLYLLSAAYDDADQAEQAGALIEGLATVPAAIVAQAFAGFAGMAALAQFFLEQHRIGS